MPVSNKQWFRVHGWLGIHFGFLLFVICLSGTIATLSAELDWLLDSELRNPAPSTVGAKDVGIDKLYASAQKQYPRADITGLRIPPEPYLPAQASASDPDRGTLVLYLDRYSGDFLAERSQVSLKVFFRIFHKQFFLIKSPYSFHGLYIVGLFAFILLLSVLTGLLFLKSWLKKLTRLHWHKGLRVFLVDWHRSTGLWALLFSLLFSLTGIWYWVEIVADIGEVGLVPADTISTQRYDSTLPPPDIGQYVSEAQAAMPGLEVSTLLLNRGSGEPVHLFGQTDTLLVRDAANYAAIEPYDPEVLHLRNSSSMGLFQRWTHTADPLHFGNFAGLWIKLIWFFFGLLITVSIAVGYCLWHLRIRAAPERASLFSRGPLFASNTLTVLVLAAATAFSLVALTRMTPTTPSGILFLGEYEIGPWRVQVSQRLDKDSRRGDITLFFPLGEPNLSQSELTLVREHRSERLPLKRAGRVWATRDLTSAVLVETDEHPQADLRWQALTLRLEDHQGRSYTQTLAHHESSTETRSDIQAAKPPPPQSLAIRLFIYGFLASLWLLLALWLWLQKRMPVAASDKRRTPSNTDRIISCSTERRFSGDKK